LIKALQITNLAACRGSQTPYPQKRQQTLGATLEPLWKTAENLEFSGLMRGLPLKNIISIKKQPRS
jgi:hypothetical protein